ncbi:MAG TPA: hypothetical protein VMV72_05150 [Verrucomicrobiae bacterium]|nr:hypothetical protein [Verrucomicrobiae bacterium]
MIDGHNLDDITLEVFTCCEPFRARVYRELMREMYRTSNPGPTHARGVADSGFAL